MNQHFGTGAAPPASRSGSVVAVWQHQQQTPRVDPSFPGNGGVAQNHQSSSSSSSSQPVVARAHPFRPRCVVCCSETKLDDPNHAQTVITACNHVICISCARRYNVAPPASNNNNNNSSSSNAALTAAAATTWMGPCPARCAQQQPVLMMRAVSNRQLMQRVLIADPIAQIKSFAAVADFQRGLDGAAMARMGQLLCMFKGQVDGSVRRAQAAEGELERARAEIGRLRAQVGALQAQQTKILSSASSSSSSAHQHHHPSHLLQNNNNNNNLHEQHHNIAAPSPSNVDSFFHHQVSNNNNCSNSLPKAAGSRRGRDSPRPQLHGLHSLHHQNNNQQQQPPGSSPPLFRLNTPTMTLRGGHDGTTPNVINRNNSNSLLAPGGHNNNNNKNQLQQQQHQGGGGNGLLFDSQGKLSSVPPLRSLLTGS